MQPDRNDGGKPAALGVGIAKVEGRPGVQVVEVVQGSPAEMAGIRPGDFLLSIDGNEVTSVPLMCPANGRLDTPE